MSRFELVLDQSRINVPLPASHEELGDPASKFGPLRLYPFQRTLQVPFYTHHGLI